MEFQPVADYANLRHGEVSEVEVRTTPPEKPYLSLGVMVIRDVTGNIYDSAFRSMIKREARKRGAEGAWIKRRVLRSTTTFRTSSVNPSPMARGSRPRSPTGSLRSDVGVVKILLYNYKREGSLERDEDQNRN